MRFYFLVAAAAASAFVKAIKYFGIFGVGWNTLELFGMNYNTLADFGMLWHFSRFTQLL